MATVTITAQGLITRALKLLGVQAAGETLGAEDAKDGLEALSVLMDAYGTQRLLSMTTAETSFTVTADQGTYTLGVGGSWNGARPLSPAFEARYLAPGTTQSVPLSVEGPEAYAAVWDHTQTGAIPSRLFYQPTFPLATVQLWPVPTQGGTIVVSAPVAVAAFADLTTPYTLPSGYARMLAANLAIELAPLYGVMPSPVVVTMAADSLADVKRVNLPGTVHDVRPRVGGYDITTDEYV